MATISSASMGSGLDVKSLVSQLVAADRAVPDKRLLSNETKVTTELSAVASLKGAMGGLQAAIVALKGSSSFDLRQTTVGDDQYFAASATASAVAGHYDVEVVQLASAARLSSAGFPTQGGGPSTVVGTGTLTIQVGTDSFDVAITSDNDMLSQVRDAINSAPDNSGVRATLITDVDGTHLVLTGTRSGLGGEITVAGTDADGNDADALGLSQLFQVHLEEKQPAQQAIVRVSGFEIRNDSNTINGAIEGVTLTLKKATPPADGLNPADTVALDVSRDDPAIQKKAETFIAAFNSLAAQIKTLGGYNADTKTGGALLGDAMLRGIDTQMRRLLSERVTGATGAYTSLASLGITTTATGSLELDATKFKAALESNPLAVQNVFASDSGVAVKMDKFLTAKLASTGEIAVRNENLASRQKSIESQRDALDARMEVVERRYLKQFTALDTMLTQLQGTSSYLTTQLDSLASLASRER
ncbi:MAG: flagellar filament capping protein FliD [Steroidobacteraceae bacterium]